MSEQLYVLLLPTGKFGYVTRPMKFGEEHDHLNEVSDLNQATARLKRQWNHFKHRGTLLPVEEVRTLKIVNIPE